MGVSQRIHDAFHHLRDGWLSSRRLNRLFPWTVLLLGLIITLFLWRYTQRQVAHDLETEFHATVEEVVRDIRLRMATNKLVLHGLQGLFSSSSSVSPQAFHTYVQTLDLKTRYPDIQALGFILATPAALPPGRGRSQNGASWQHYTICPARPPRAASDTSCHPCIAEDLPNSPALREAMDGARQHHRVVLSGKFPLKPPDGQTASAAFALVLPLPPPQGQGPSTQMAGWVYAQFCAHELGRRLSAGHKKKIAWSLYDGEGISASALLVASHPLTDTAHHHPLWRTTQTIHIANHTWTLTATSLPQFDQRVNRALPWFILVSGAGVSLLLAGFMYLLTQGHRRALELARDMNQALIKSEYRWKFALEGAGQSVWDWNLSTGYMFQSNRLKQDMLGYPEEAYPDDFAFWKQLLHPEDAPVILQALDDYRDGKTKDFVVEGRMRCKNGAWKWILMRGMIVSRDSIGHPLRMIGTHTDIDERHQNDESLRLSSAVLETMVEAVFITDATNNILSVNPSFTKITGFLPEDVIGKKMTVLAAGPDTEEKMQTMQGFLEQDGSFAGELTHRRKTGELYVAWLSISTVRNHLGEMTNRVAVFSDISERKANEERMQYLAHFDPLTDLPNRALFADRLRQALAICRRSQERLAVLFVDLDKFKPVNDTLGHAIGDLLLKEVAFRLLDNIRESDSAARLGGDEFVIVLTAVETEQDAILVAEKILASINKPYLLDGHTVTISCSIGIAIYPNHGHTDQELLSHADEAMYFSKHGGGSAVATYSQLQRDAKPASSL